MYISHVKLRNIRGFADLDLSFQSSAGDSQSPPRKWTVLLGDNATGKSTLLKCIAFGLCDESTAAGLVTDKTEGFVRQGEHSGSVYIELVDEKERCHWTIKTDLNNGSPAGEQVEQNVYRTAIEDVENGSPPIESNNFPWGSLFVAGYGAGRSPDGVAKYEKYRRNDAVYTLFDYQTPLQDPELVWRRLLSAARNGHEGEDAENKRIRKLLRDVLLLRDDEDICLEDNGIRVSGPGFTVPLSSHSDGYKATTVWLLDLLSWRMLYDKNLSQKSMQGILLIDEIEQHLHPRWQRYIVSRLHSQFPNFQFIATTHSPLCAVGTTELQDEDCELVVLQRSESRGTVISDFPIPRGKRADQILTSALFGLSTSGDNEQKRQVNRFAELTSKKNRSHDEEDEFVILKQQLNSTIGSAETPLENSVAQAVKSVLQNPPELTDISDQAVSYEILRQLREIFGGSDK